jgi:ankyrin repeat protein
VAGSREAVVRLLVEKGVEADSKDKYRQTPLLWATGGPNGAVVQLL